MSDPGIILAAGNINDPQKQTNGLISMFSLAQAVKKSQQEQIRVNALRDAFTNPASVDPITGLPTKDAIRKVMTVDPELGVKLQDDALEAQVKRAQAQHYKTEAGKNNFDFMSGVAGIGYDAYSAAKKAGKSEADAITAGQAARNDAVKNNGGTISDDLADGIMGKPFDPAGAKALAGSNKEWLAEQRGEQQVTRNENREKDADRRADQADRRMAAAMTSQSEKGWSDPYTTKDGKTISINKGTGEVREIKGVDGLKKVGSSTGADFTPKMGELMAATAEQGVSLPTGFRSKAQQVQLYQGLLDRNPDLTADEIAKKLKTGQIEFGAQKKETQTAAGVAGKVEVAQNEIKEFTPLVQQASAKVPRGSFVPLNKLMQTADTSLSDPNLKALKIRINSLLNAYDMLASRGGTDKDKRGEVRNLLLSADSPEALESALTSFNLEADAAHRAAVKATKVPELENQKAPASGSKVLRYDAQGNLVP